MRHIIIAMSENQQILLPSLNSLIPMDLHSTTDLANPQIILMHYDVNVGNRYVRTLITSEVRNLNKSSKETTFSVIVPENAFISEFEMEIDGIVYKAYVKEKEEAKNIYQKAVASNLSAAHVELSARDSKTFTVSVNIEPESKTIFRLVYEELLLRQNGQYELIVNIHPRQIVEDFGVKVHIKESRPITFIKTASLRTGNEISKDDPKLDPLAKIETLDPCSVNVTFNPDASQQKKFAESLGGKKDNGLAGQFVVQYEVERDSQGGEVLIRDGYFVYFFAPTNLEPLPKHIVFVLDHSDSMGGNKIDQLIDAMQNILSQLEIHDLFSIIRFSDEASVWNANRNKFITVNLNSPNYGYLEPQLREENLPEAVEATKLNIEKAKFVIRDKNNMDCTNIIAGLEIGLFLIKMTQENSSSKYQPMLIFLTDGLPNVGISSGDAITEIVTKINSGENRTAIFSLSFGDDADKSFLNKLSARNFGFSKHIYEASDASLQLQDFYSKISSPVMSDVTFTDVEGTSELTKTYHPILFNGSELIVAGKAEDKNISHSVSGRSTKGHVIFNPTYVEPVSSLERLWAYLTVKQLLYEKETAADATALTRRALDLSLKYSFVTEVSSLIVVKPRSEDVVHAETASLDEREPMWLPDFLHVSECSAGEPIQLSRRALCYSASRFKISASPRSLARRFSSELRDISLGSMSKIFGVSNSKNKQQVTADYSLVIVNTDPAQTENKIVSDFGLQVNLMHIKADVNDHHVKTQITGHLENLKGSIEERTFPIILPKSGFISGLEMEINGKLFQAYFKKRAKARKIYQQAISTGQDAALIELSEKKTKLFTLSINIQPGNKTVFRLVYEDLLQRQNAHYELVINLHPGQIVEDFGIEVSISVGDKLSFVKTPPLRKISEMSKENPELDSCSEIYIVSDSSAVVKFNPNVIQQKKFAELLDDDVENGLSCQFVVEYDVEKNP